MDPCDGLESLKYSRSKGDAVSILCLGVIDEELSGEGMGDILWLRYVCQTCVDVEEINNTRKKGKRAVVLV